jgi:hypothetical protein
MTACVGSRVKALVVFAVVAAARIASAEINVAVSVEWATADSDAVVRGTIVKLDSWHGDGQVVWYDATVRVAETFKGAAKREIHVVTREVGSDRPEKWRASKADLVMFLVGGARRVRDDKDYASYPLVPRYGNGDSFLEVGKTQAYTADFAALVAEHDVVTALRAAAKSKATQSLRVDVPSQSAAYKALWGGSAVWMYVPIDAALEKRAITWLTAPDIYQRQDAVAALAHFKTADNIKLVTGLLGDPLFWTSGNTRHYAVRAKAHEVLTAWGVAHATPIIDE